MSQNLTPSTVTTLGALRPGDVGEFIDKTLSPEIGRFLVNSCVIGDCVYCLNDDRYYEGYRKVKTAVRYLGRGRIEPARIVMDSEPDRVAELEAQVRTLRTAIREAWKNLNPAHFVLNDTALDLFSEGDVQSGVLAAWEILNEYAIAATAPTEPRQCQ